jgi:hypothetical protein
MNKIEKEDIESLKQEELREEKFWKGYSYKLKEQISSENIFLEVEKFKVLKIKEKNNFFKKILKVLGF